MGTLADLQNSLNSEAGNRNAGGATQNCPKADKPAIFVLVGRSDTMAAVSGVSVEISGATKESKNTAGDGLARFDPVKKGKHKIKAKLTDTQLQDFLPPDDGAVTVGAGDVGTHMILLGGKPNLEVTVMLKQGDWKNPLPDIVVELEKGTEKTSAKPSGLAKFTKVKPGKYTVRVKLTPEQEKKYVACEPAKVTLTAGVDAKLTLELVPAVSNAIRITRLSRWFVPGHESCDLGYKLEGRKYAADKVELEVHASNYCELNGWNDGLPTFKPLADTPVFTQSFGGKNVDEKADVKIDTWKGTTSCTKGILAPAADVATRHIHAACSPYTVLFRYYKAPGDNKARLELTPFWPVFKDGKAKADSLKITWKIKNTTKLKQGQIVIWDRDGKEVFKKELEEGDVTQGDHNFTWNGKVEGGGEIEPAKQPYRVQVQAFAAPGEQEGLALAAMHTEVRIRVHKDRNPATDKNYQPVDDKKDLRVDVGNLIAGRTAAPVRADGRIWMQYRLAMAGFHPGPVDGKARPEFTLALKEFQRSYPKRRPGGAGDYQRLTADGSENDDTKNALEDLVISPSPRPWFGNPGDRSDMARDDGRARFADPTKDLIVWVDDRHSYTGSDDPDIRGTVFQMGDYRGVMSIGDQRVTKDADSIARPWIPVQTQVQLLLKSQQLDTNDDPTTDATLLEHMRAATGPLRIDWSFEEIDWDYANDELGDGPVALVDTGRYRRDYTRTKTFLKHTFEKLKAKHKRKDVERNAVYVNCPEKEGGIRPASLATYNEKAFGTGDNHLAPWKNATDKDTESVVTCVHDVVGQTKAQFFTKAHGRAGAFFVPSRIAGDGYRVRAQLRFEAGGGYDFPNLKVLAARYPSLPQGYSASLRLWRKCSLRAYLKWSNTAQQWDALSVSFPEFYLPAFTHFVYEGGVSRKYALNDIFDLGQPAQVNAYKDIVATRVSNFYKLRDKATMTVDPKYVYPYFPEDNFGWPFNSTKNCAFGDLYDDQITQELLNATWRSYRERLMFELVKRIETKYGILRGHIVVEFDASPEYNLEEYECDGACGGKYWYIEKGAGGTMANKACPSPGCAGKVQRQAPAQIFASGYNGLPLPAVGTCLGATWIFSTGTAETWAHEVGHHKHLEHAATAPGAQPKQHDSKKNSKGAFANGTAKANKNWDRNCVMSYASDAEQLYFDGKSVLRIRGWRVESLKSPGSGKQDP